MAKVVVTGAGGHVGCTLIRQLLAEGREVLAVDLDHGPGLADLDIERRSGDIRDPDFMASVLQEGDTLFHLASVISTSGDKGGLVSSVNIEGARNVAQAALAKKVKRMVHFSSIHAYDIDSHGAPVTETTRPATANSSSAYNRSKWLGQAAVLEVVKQGLDAVIVNPCGVVGPYDYKPSRMGKVLRAVARGGRHKMGPGGFEWVDVRDVVAGALAAQQSGKSGEAYILGGHWLTSLEMGKTMGRLAGNNHVPDQAVPMWLVRSMYWVGVPMRILTGKPPPVTREALDALQANKDISSEKAKRELGYAPRPMEQTLHDTYQWYLEADQLKRPAKPQ